VSTLPGEGQNATTIQALRLDKARIRHPGKAQRTPCTFRPSGALDEELELLESGLDSLCFAIIVVRLEDILGLDPFSTLEDGRIPVTLEEFIKLYENAAS
jgi:hypothetical protein